VTDAQVKATTTDAGAPVESDEHSLTVGPDGPILLHDHYLIEQMANFNRERIPERQPHAKGAERSGTSSDARPQRLHQGRRVSARHQDDTLIRFSTVAASGQPRHLARPARLLAEVLHQRGQLRHGREQHPVFFIRDPMKFQHFIRSQKRRADNNLRDHDMQWDFWTLSRSRRTR